MRVARAATAGTPLRSMAGIQGRGGRNLTASSTTSGSTPHGRGNGRKRKLAEHLSTRGDESLHSFLKRVNPAWNKNGGKALNNVLMKLKRVGITELEGLCRVLFQSRRVLRQVQTRLC